MFTFLARLKLTSLYIFLKLHDKINSPKMSKLFNLKLKHYNYFYLFLIISIEYDY